MFAGLGSDDAVDVEAVAALVVLDGGDRDGAEVGVDVAGLEAGVLAGFVRGS